MLKTFKKRSHCPEFIGDRLLATDGGGNSINGMGADQFWIADAGILNDFTSGEDVIGVAGLGIGFTDHAKK